MTVIGGDGPRFFYMPFRCRTDMVMSLVGSILLSCKTILVSVDVMSSRVSLKAMRFKRYSSRDRPFSFAFLLRRSEASSDIFNVRLAID